MSATKLGFLLTRQWRDRSGRGERPQRGEHPRRGRRLVDGDRLGECELSFWFSTDDGPVRVVIEGHQPVCFVERGAVIDPASAGAAFERRELALKTLPGAPVDGLYLRRQRDLRALRQAVSRGGVELFESDVKPQDRYLMERFITGAAAITGEAERRGGFIEYRNPRLARADYRPSLRHVAIDIETEGLDGKLYSIAVATPEESTVFMAAEQRGRQGETPIAWCGDEAGVLQAFLDWLEENDPDLILGWNVAGFDLDFVERKCAELGLPFAVARAREGATILQPEGGRGTAIARVPGRVVLDGIELLRAGFWSFESFELEVVARELLGRGKAIKSPGNRLAEINRMYRDDPAALAAYNLEDCRLVLEIFAKAKLLDFARERAEVTGLAMDRYGGSVAAFDHLYLPRLHRAGRVAPDVKPVSEGAGSPGGYVLDSRPGLYDHVLLLDFKSLYPSIIRTFHIDPLALAESGDDPVPGFDGAAFSREKTILPELVRDLWAVRDRAKANGDAPLSQAVKILMNSLYGVLGAYGCRFFDPRLTSSITRRGHEIIRKSKAFIEDQGHEVIYGDTDSLFILPGGVEGEAAIDKAGAALATTLNDWWRAEIERRFRLTSFLEVEYETHFIRFLMPTIRGADTGSKKRYAGLVRRADGATSLVFKGLESVRTDWTPLAQRFQRELYRRIFENQPFDAYIRETVEDLHEGRLDEELVYRKRLRRRLEDYTRNVPPHVQAARKLDRPERWIRYVITRTGPEPVIDSIPKPDYQHYQEKQLVPVADGILGFVDASFEAIAGKQLNLL